MDSLLEKLQLDDLEDDQRELAECIGMEAYRKLVENYAGSSIYIGKPDRIAISVRDNMIRADFNGYNYSELRKKYSLSESTIRRITSPVLITVKNAPMEGQTSLFDKADKAEP